MTAFIAFLIAFGVTILIFLIECVFRGVKNKNNPNPLNSANQTGLDSSSETTTHNDTAQMEKTGPIFSDDMKSRNASVKSALEP